MSGEYVVYGAKGSGSVAVEAALTLLGAPYEVVERAPWESREAADAVGRSNPLRQVPAVILPDGELMTESAAILIHLADSHAKPRLAPGLKTPARARFLRWMVYVSAAIYSLYWVRDDLTRLAADKSHEAVLAERTAKRIAHCWAMMEAQLDRPGLYLLGDDLSVLDLYVAVVSRWGPSRKAFYQAAPRMTEAVRRVDADPRLAELWAERFPFEAGWEG